uniref:Bardet-Biedl syndrome 8 protein n=1 Tax=Trypanosoma vivax (strain Y486) TaxID=1055687 RepID=G0U8D1_TRYVY|nr:conserved hypothetical protein [Trypanosoma vivax Y486]
MTKVLALLITYIGASAVFHWARCVVPLSFSPLHYPRHVLVTSPLFSWSCCPLSTRMSQHTLCALTFATLSCVEGRVETYSYVYTGNVQHLLPLQAQETRGNLSLFVCLCMCASGFFLFPVCSRKFWPGETKSSLMEKTMNAGKPASSLPPPTAPPKLPTGIDPTYYALSLLRRRRLDECIAVTKQFLAAAAQMKSTPEHASQEQGPAQRTSITDSPLWFIQTRALATRNLFEEIDMDDDGLDNVLLEGEQAVHSSVSRPPLPSGLPRPPALNSGIPKPQLQQPRQTGRPISSRSGFARPGSQCNRPGSSAARPVSSRLMRIGTASLQAISDGSQINVQRLDLNYYVKERPILAKLLCDYLLHVEHRPKTVLELCTLALANQLQNSQDWWWMSRLGQAYYRLGLLREAEQQFKAALAVQENVADVLRLAKVYARMDQPLKALEILTNASRRNPMDHHLLVGMARLHEQLQDMEKSSSMYRRVLQLDSTSVEAIACIAAYHFYENQQPELALRLYRRLLQMGVQTTELWNNLGLCCLYSSQYDIALSCLHRAAATAGNDEILSDVWYNIGHVGIVTGDLRLAERAFLVAIEANPNHTEAFNNLAVLHLRIGT